MSAHSRTIGSHSFNIDARLRRDLATIGRKFGFDRRQIERLVAATIEKKRNSAPSVKTRECKTLLDHLSTDGVQQQLQIFERQKADIEEAIDQLKKELREGPLS